MSKPTGECCLGHRVATRLEQAKRINRPSLYIAGEASFVPMTATKWAADNTPGSQFESFGPDEGGNHFMFIENPDRFNDIVARFLVGDS